MWSGAATSKSFAIMIRGYGGSDLVVSDSTGHSVFEFNIPVSNTYDVMRVDVTDLRPNTMYEYRVGEDVGRVKTFSSGVQSTLRVGLSSCGASGSTSDVYSEIANQNIDLFIHQGDIHYEDIAVNDTDVFLDAFDIVHSSSSQRKLYQSAPIVYMYDDHDFGPNNADKMSPSLDAAISNYRRSVAHYELERHGDGAVYHAFNIGRIRFVVPDLKSEMLNEGRIMSSKQLEWFLSEIRNAKRYAAVVLALGVPWVSETEGWSQYPEDRTIVSNTILEVFRNSTGASLGGHANIIGIAGDAHMLAFDDGTNSRSGIPIIQAAPLERIGSNKGGTYTSGCFGFSASFTSQYAILDISDSGVGGSESVCMHVELRRAGVSSPLYETSFCGPFINNTKRSDFSKVCYLPMFTPSQQTELVFGTIFFFLVLALWLGRSISTWTFFKQKIAPFLCRNCSVGEDTGRCCDFKGQFAAYNVGIGSLWLALEMIILGTGILSKSYKPYRASDPANLFRLMLITFVPLCVLLCISISVKKEDASGTKNIKLPPTGPKLQS